MHPAAPSDPDARHTPGMNSNSPTLAEPPTAVGLMKALMLLTMFTRPSRHVSVPFREEPPPVVSVCTVEQAVTESELQSHQGVSCHTRKRQHTADALHCQHYRAVQSLVHACVIVLSLVNPVYRYFTFCSCLLTTQLMLSHHEHFVCMSLPSNKLE
jgi:hypothetical protein